MCNFIRVISKPLLNNYFQLGWSVHKSIYHVRCMITVFMSFAISKISIQYFYHYKVMWRHNHFYNRLDGLIRLILCCNKYFKTILYCKMKYVTELCTTDFSSRTKDEILILFQRIQLDYICIVFHQWYVYYLKK